MKIICHRGNLNGPNAMTENHPMQIDKCIENGYDVEIDLWAGDGLWLGHDQPQYPTTKEWLTNRARNLWIHCKNVESMAYLREYAPHLHYFWHQEDDYTLTSHGWCWVYPNKPVPKSNPDSFYSLRSVAVMPEIYNSDVTNFQAVCTDYVETYTV